MIVDVRFKFSTSIGSPQISSKRNRQKLHDQYFFKLYMKVDTGGIGYGNQKLLFFGNKK